MSKASVITGAEAVTDAAAEPIISGPAPESLRILGTQYSVGAINKLGGDSLATVGRLPLLPGEDKSKYTSKGLSVRRMDAYDWARVERESGVSAVERGKIAVRRVLALQAFNLAFKGQGS